MQVFRLVRPGEPDKVIAFDELPKRLTDGLTKIEPNGMPRHWSSYLKEIGSTFKKTVWDAVELKNSEIEVAGFFILDYIFVNKDKERWQEIVNYARKNCSAEIRLLDKFEDMAKPLADNSHSELSLEPEDIPIIKLEKLAKTVKSAEAPSAMVEAVTEQSTVAPLVRRGRPKKELQEV
jgi:hypothetical protein